MRNFAVVFAPSTPRQTDGGRAVPAKHTPQTTSIHEPLPTDKRPIGLYIRSFGLDANQAPPRGDGFHTRTRSHPRMGGSAGHSHRLQNEWAKGGIAPLRSQVGRGGRNTSRGARRRRSHHRRLHHRPAHRRVYPCSPLPRQLCRMSELRSAKKTRTH